jgi:signal peptidase II
LLRDRRVLFWILTLVLIAADQATKAWVREDLVVGQSKNWPFPRVFEITLTFNQGIAFGMFQGAGLLMAPVAVGIALAMMLYSHRNPHEARVKHVAAALLAAGALGNLYDRVFHGRVTDMFLLRLSQITKNWPFQLDDFPVFNIADACITAAAILLIVIWSLEARHEAKAAVEHADSGVPEPDGPPAGAPSMSPVQELDGTAETRTH